MPSHGLHVIACAIPGIIPMMVGHLTSNSLLMAEGSCILLLGCVEAHGVLVNVII